MSTFSSSSASSLVLGRVLGKPVPAVSVRAFMCVHVLWACKSVPCIHACVCVRGHPCRQVVWTHACEH